MKNKDHIHKGQEGYCYICHFGWSHTITPTGFVSTYTIKEGKWEDEFEDIWEDNTTVAADYKKRILKSFINDTLMSERMRLIEEIRDWCEENWGESIGMKAMMRKLNKIEEGL